MQLQRGRYIYSYESVVMTKYNLLSNCTEKSLSAHDVFYALFIKHFHILNTLHPTKIKNIIFFDKITTNALKLNIYNEGGGWEGGGQRECVRVCQLL